MGEIRQPTREARDRLDRELAGFGEREAQNAQFFAFYGRHAPLLARHYTSWQKDEEGHKIPTKDGGFVPSKGTRTIPLRTREWIERFVRIRDKRGGIVPLIPNFTQRNFHAAVLRQRRAGLPVRQIVLKARKQGISTWSEALAFEASVRDKHSKSLVVAHDDDTSSEVLKMVALMRDNTPKASGGKWEFGLKHQATYHIAWLGPMYGELKIASASKNDPGRGFTPNFCHLCLAPSTPILVENGRLVEVRQAAVGDCVLTHTGHKARIRAITAKPPSEANGAGRSVKITPWLGHEIELTPNHPVWTARGFVPAGELTLDDEVGMPVRPISETVHSLRMPTWSTLQIGKRGRRALGMGMTLRLSEEIGFAFGYYLAEGSLGRNGSKAASVTFTRHRNEKPYADRAALALAGWYTSRRTSDTKGCLTSTDTLYGSALARLIEMEFGATDKKRVPDWVFSAGRDFARGLLAGYLSGDGSKTNGKQGKYELPEVCATSICSSVSFQVRDIAASLGYGWANIDHKAAGVRHGRVEREAWTVRWAGRAARGLRALVGLAPVPGGHAFTEKAVLSGGYAWMRIRKLEAGRLELVYDVEVDHADHSFRTAFFAVKNSEMAFYPDAERTMKSILNSVPKLKTTTIIIESTAFGDVGEFRNRFWAAWDERGIALHDRNQSWNANFYPWFWDDDCRWTRTVGEGRALPVDMQFEIRSTLNDHERWLLTQKFFRRWRESDTWEEVTDGGRRRWRRKEAGWRTVDIDQLAWRRFALRDEFNANPHKPETWGPFQEEFPATPEEAFRATGELIFDVDRVHKHLSLARDPVWMGDLVDMKEDDADTTLETIKTRLLMPPRE